MFVAYGCGLATPSRILRCRTPEKHRGRWEPRCAAARLQAVGWPAGGKQKNPPSQYGAQSRRRFQIEKADECHRNRQPRGAVKLHLPDDGQTIEDFCEIVKTGFFRRNSHGRGGNRTDGAATSNRSPSPHACDAVKYPYRICLLLQNLGAYV